MPQTAEARKLRYRVLDAMGLCVQCSRARDSGNKLCATCTDNSGKASAKWKSRNPNADRDKQLRRKYGLTRADWDAMFEAQGRRCAICGIQNPVRSWTVDHCHATGRVRAILCHPCNVGLGQFNDKAELLIAAAGYLRAHSGDPAN
jgi:hypothetical protein